MQTTIDRLKVIINSSTALIVLETVEEMRAVSMLRQACSDLALPLFEWSIADGLSRSGMRTPPSPPTGGVVDFYAAESVPPIPPQQGMYNTQEPTQALSHLMNTAQEAVYVLKDFHRHLDSPVVVRRLKDLAEQFSRDRRTVILLGPIISVPAELETLAEHLDLPHPDRQRLKEITEETFTRLSRKMTLKRTATADHLDEIASKLLGMTEEEAERAIAQAIVARYGLVPEIAADVLEAKQDILRRTGMLDFIPVSHDLSSVGGLENLKAWLARRSGALDDEAAKFGLEAPRGIIIMGVQGCGKSLCARAIAGAWKLPLVRMNTAQLYDKFVGETEKRVQKMFAVAEQLAPVVLWIDELEKIFAGSGPESASADSGVSARMLGSFLSWLQERKAPVFVAATSNNIHVLPPELIRKGRFDEIFFVDLPNTVERRAVLEVQLRRRKRNPGEFELAALVKACSGFSGAEIDTAVQSAMFSAFSERKPLATEHILTEFRRTVPLSRTRAEEIQRLRAWAQERAVPASMPDAAGASGP